MNIRFFLAFMAHNMLNGSSPEDAFIEAALDYDMEFAEYEAARPALHSREGIGVIIQPEMMVREWFMGKGDEGRQARVKVALSDEDRLAVSSMLGRNIAAYKSDGEREQFDSLSLLIQTFSSLRPDSDVEDRYLIKETAKRLFEMAFPQTDADPQ